jgi:hypothetical protein
MNSNSETNVGEQRMSIRKKISERFKNQKDEKGGALLTFLGVGSIIGITTLGIAGAAAFGTILTHKNLGGKQATISAESGLSEALFKLSNGACVPTGSDSNLKYSFQVYHSQESTVPTSTDSTGLIAGCPTDSDQWVSIQAEAEGKNDVSKKTFATYKWDGAEPNVLPQVITGKQINLTSVEIPGSANGLKVRPTIFSKEGGVSCEDSSEKLKNVNISVENTSSLLNCVIKGDIHLKGDADLDSTSVDGDVCSTGFLSNTQGVAGKTIEGALTCGDSGSMYGYKPSFASNTVALAPNDCSTFEKFKSIVETQYSAPTILNASACGSELNGILSSDDAKTLKLDSNNLTLIVDEATAVRNLSIETTSGPATLNFVVPSATSDSNQSTCENAASLNLENVFYKDGVTGMIYSPCSITLKDSDISGQVYGGDSVSADNTRIQYSPVEFANAQSKVSDGNASKHLIRVF